MIPPRGFAAIGLLVAWLACGVDSSAASLPGSRVARRGPHGGRLVVVGSELAIEFLYDLPKGKLTAYALDSRTGQPCRISEEATRLQITLADIDGRPVNGPAARFAMSLERLNAPGAGRPGEASGFEGSSPVLQGVQHFQGIIEGVSAGSLSVKNVPFRYVEP